MVVVPPVIASIVSSETVSFDLIRRSRDFLIEGDALLRLRSKNPCGLVSGQKLQFLFRHYLSKIPFNDDYLATKRYSFLLTVE